MNQIFEQIAELSFEIYNMYQRLVYIEINGPYNLNYDEDKNQIIARLTQLKLTEDELYLKLENDSEALAKTASFLLNQKPASNKDELDNQLIRQRIQKRILSLSNKNGILKLKMLIKSSNDLIQIPDDIAFTLNQQFADSFDFRVASLINDTLAQNEKIDFFTKEKILQAFQNKKLEDNYINNGFSTVPCNFSKEIKVRNGIDEKIKEELFSTLAIDIIKKSLVALISMLPSKEATFHIIKIKAALLYLNKEELKFLKDTILHTAFNSFIISQMLINAIDNIDIIKATQNKDIGQTIDLN